MKKGTGKKERNCSCHSMRLPEILLLLHTQRDTHTGTLDQRHTHWVLSNYAPHMQMQRVRSSLASLSFSLSLSLSLCFCSVSILISPLPLSLSPLPHLTTQRACCAREAGQQRQCDTTRPNGGLSSLPRTAYPSSPISLWWPGQFSLGSALNSVSICTHTDAAITQRATSHPLLTNCRRFPHRWPFFA